MLPARYDLCLEVFRDGEGMNWCGELVGDVGVIFDGGEDEVLLPLVEFRRSPFSSASRV